MSVPGSSWIRVSGNLGPVTFIVNKHVRWFLPQWHLKTTDFLYGVSTWQAPLHSSCPLATTCSSGPHCPSLNVLCSHVSAFELAMTYVWNTFLSLISESRWTQAYRLQEASSFFPPRIVSDRFSVVPSSLLHLAPPNQVLLHYNCLCLIL